MCIRFSVTSSEWLDALRLIVFVCVFAIAGSVAAQEPEKAIGVQEIEHAVQGLPADLHVPNRFALIIGASQYQDDRIPDLPACSNDALGLYSVLTDPTIGMFPKDHVTLLVDDQVSRGAVIDALDELGRQAGPDDLVLVFFSGHGAVDSRGRSYWVMQDTQVDKLRATALPENEITDLLGDIKTTRLVTMIDACFSASTASLGDNKSIIDLKKIFPEFDGKGRIAMTASAGDQLSVVIPEGQPGYGYSAFAYHLIEGLKGHADGAGGQSKEGVITVDELWAYVKDRTETTARKAGGNQRPQLKGAFGSRFMLTVDSQRLVAASQSVKQQITALKALLLDDKITGEHYEQAKALLATPVAQLDEQGQKIRKVYVDLVEGRLDASYLGSVLAASTSPSETKPDTVAQAPDASYITIDDGIEVVQEPLPNGKPLLTLEDVKASLPEEMVAMVYPQIKIQAAEVATKTDIEGLRAGLEEMNVQIGMIPPQLNTAVAFMIQQTQKRIRELESGPNSESSTSTDAFPIDLAETERFNFALNKLQDAIQKSSEPHRQRILDWLISIDSSDPAKFVQTVGASGVTPLHYAAAFDVPEAVTEFIKVGANIQAKIHPSMMKGKGNTGPNRLIGMDIQMPIGGESPLHTAVQSKAYSAISALIESGADVNAGCYLRMAYYSLVGWEFSSDATPLQLAVLNHDIESMRILLNSGANVNFVDSEGDTPLHTAARANNADAVSYLIRHGANVTIKGMGGRTPLNRAKKHHCRLAVAAFKAAGVKK